MPDRISVVMSPICLTVPSGSWFVCDVSLWQCKCYLFVGTTLEMMSSVAEENPPNPIVRSLSKDCREFVWDWLNRHKDFPSGGDAFGKDTICFIRLDEFVIGHLEEDALFMHECLHAANGILRAIGLQGDGNCEGLAYTQEFIYLNFMKQMMSAKGLEPVRIEKGN